MKAKLGLCLHVALCGGLREFAIRKSAGPTKLKSVQKARFVGDR